MKAKNGVIDNGSKGKVGEYFNESMPGRGVAIFFAYLVIETIGSGERGGLVVSSKKRDGLGI